MPTVRTNTGDVVVGTPICRRTSFILDKFLSNQQEIQQAYPACMLVFATDEPDFVAELKGKINKYNLKVEVINYKTVKPDYAKSRVWSVTCAREALRNYTLSYGAEYFLSFDADMIYEASVVSIMKGKIQRFDVIFSGYRKAPFGLWGFGNGCVMINKKMLNKLTFSCYEFSGGKEVDESEMLDLSLLKCHAKIVRGIFVSIKHYQNSEEYYAIKSQPVSWFRLVSNNLLIRYVLIRISIVTKTNIARKLQTLLYRILKFELRK